MLILVINFTFCKEYGIVIMTVLCNYFHSVGCIRDNRHYHSSRGTIADIILHFSSIIIFKRY